MPDTSRGKNISLLVEGDLIGSTKQRVTVDRGSTHTARDLVACILGQLTGENGEAVPRSNPAFYALQYFHLDERQYVPLDDLDAQLHDKLKVRIVRVGDGSGENGTRAAGDVNDRRAESQRLGENRAAAEIAGMVVAQLASLIPEEFPVSLDELEEITGAVVNKHQLSADAAESGVVAEVRSEIAAGFRMGRQRRQSSGPRYDLEALKRLCEDQERTLAEHTSERRALVSRIAIMEDELARVRQIVNADSPRRVVDAPSYGSRPVMDAGVAGTPTQAGRAPTSADTSPVHPPAPPASPAVQHSRPERVQPARGSAMRPSTAGAPKFTPLAQPDQATIPTRPQSAASRRPLDARSAVSDDAPMYMVTCFFNDYDRARKHNVKRGRAFVLTGGHRGGYLGQLLSAVKNAWNRDDLQIGYALADGSPLVVSSESALRAYLQSAIRHGETKPVLQCFDSSVLEPEVGISAGPTWRHEDAPALPPRSSTYASEAIQGTSTPSRAVPLQPSPPLTRSGRQTPQSHPSTSRPSSVADSRVESLRPSTSVPVDVVSGSVLNEDELRWQFSYVTRDGVSASKAEVLQFIQQRYDAMGDAARFQRLVNKFRGPTLNFDEFSIVLLRLASG